MPTSRDTYVEDSYVDEPLMDGRCETSSDELVHTEQRALIEWKGVDWSTVQSHVEKIQQNIFRETRAGNFSRASKLQKLLVKSLPARLLAVRRVTEHNRGRLTPGIDGVVCIKDADKVALVESLMILRLLARYVCGKSSRRRGRRVQGIRCSSWMRGNAHVRFLRAAGVVSR